MPYALLAAAFTGLPPAKSDGLGEKQSIVGSRAAMGQKNLPHVTEKRGRVSKPLWQQDRMEARAQTCCFSPL